MKDEAAGGDLVLIAIGGNSLVRNGAPASYREQYQSLESTCREVAALVTAGWRVVVTHGNGPQVGWLLRRAELSAHELPEIPLDACGASTQGCIGYALQQRLHNALTEAGSQSEVLTVVTQVEVDPADPAFDQPTKPIGSFLDSPTADRLRARGVALMEDAGRGIRRVVPSPRPLRIVEQDTICRMVAEGVIVIAVGGGGIPVVRDDSGRLAGVAAVIDKDLASSLLARRLGAKLFVACTGVEKVFLHFGTPAQRPIDSLTVAEARRLLAEGAHFAVGSMAPKIDALVSFLEGGGSRAVVTDPAGVGRAVRGEGGTQLVA